MGAVAGAVVSGVIIGSSVKKASAASDAAAAQASDAQAIAIADADERARIREEELEAERKRIFEATKPTQESATFTFGLQNRTQMGGFSDFVSPNPNDTGARNIGFNSSSLIGGLS